MPRFVQHVPDIDDVYASDFVLRRALDRSLGEVGHKAAAPMLESLSEDVAHQLREAHRQAESHPPELVAYDAWGARVDRIETPWGWERQREAAAQHGVVSLPYETEARETWGAGARVVQLALLHLYGPESATFSCPVAMSDGAALLLSEPDVDADLRARWLPRLLSRDPATAAVSGQWMTETEGGSDVGRASTSARREGETWRLYGEKWFCSAADSAMSVALARPEGAPAGTKGLVCWVIPRYAVDSPLAGSATGPRHTAPGLTLHRLKDKLGTRALPSAEVGLDGAAAWPLGDPHTSGITRMMRLVQVTRLHNSAAAAGNMRRGLAYARAFAGSREAFGAPLWQQPLHRETLAWLAVDAEAAFHLTLMCFDLLGRVEAAGGHRAAGEHADAPDEVRLLRFAATLAKLSTGKLAVASASEYVEAFGGNGYIEDTGMPRLLRDSQVLPIWEGTTNVLSLDVLRALHRDAVLEPYLARVDAALDTAEESGDPWLGPVAAQARPIRDEVAGDARAALQAPAGQAQAGARELALRMAHLLAATALIEQAQHDTAAGDARAALVASAWVRRRLDHDPCTGEGHRAFAHIVDGERL